MDEEHLEEALAHPLSAADIAALEAEGPSQSEREGLGASATRDVVGA